MTDASWTTRPITSYGRVRLGFRARLTPNAGLALCSVVRPAASSRDSDEVIEERPRRLGVVPERRRDRPAVPVSGLAVRNGDHDVGAAEGVRGAPSPHTPLTSRAVLFSS